MTSKSVYRRIALMKGLRECPFCGSPYVTLIPADDEHPFPAIVCENCLVKVSNPMDEETLIKMWNRRANDD